MRIGVDGAKRQGAFWEQNTGWRKKQFRVARGGNVPCVRLGRILVQEGKGPGQIGGVFCSFVCFVFFCLAAFGSLLLRWLSLVVASRDYSSLRCAGFYCGGFSCCGARALDTRASVIAAHGLSSCSTQALEHTGFSSCGSQALEHRLSSCGARA